MRVEAYTSEFGRWDEVERPSNPRLRPFVHGYFGSSSSLGRAVRERHLPSVEVPMVLNFGAPHRRLDAACDGGSELFDDAWVTGLHNRFHVSEAVGERQFMAVRFTPLGAHLFLGLPMDLIANRAVRLEDVDSRVALLVRDRVMVARGWEERFDAMEALIASRLTGCAVPPFVESVWKGLVRSHGQIAVRSLAADIGYSHRHLIGQFRTYLGLTPKQVARVLRFNQTINLVTPGNPTSKPFLEGSVPPGADGDALRWADVAAECGYFDQSHFIKEFRTFAGATPSEFLRGVISTV